MDDVFNGDKLLTRKFQRIWNLKIPENVYLAIRNTTLLFIQNMTIFAQVFSIKMPQEEESKDKFNQFSLNLRLTMEAIQTSID